MLTSTRLILESWKGARARAPEGFVLMTVYGPLRLGKSAYAFKTGVQTLKELYGLEEEGRGGAWDELKRYIMFHPEHFFQKRREMDELGIERIPFLIWDDAGLWLYALDWYDPFINAFLKELNVIGTRIGALIFTTPSPKFILRKLRDFPDSINVRIIDTSVNPDHIWRRLAKGYKHWFLPDGKSRVKLKFEDEFTALMPNTFYKWYKPLRDAYEKLALKLVEEKWEQFKSKSGVLSRSMNEFSELVMPRLRAIN
jgi:hypothetical protein